MKYCGKCGFFINHKHTICPKCGRNFSSKQKSKKPSSQNNYDLRPTIDISELELKIHNLTNNERHKRGLSLLEFDPEIRDICRMHSEDMSVRNYFAHETPDGKEPSDRATDANFSFQKKSDGSNKIGLTIKKLNPFKQSHSSEWAYGENIFQTNLAHSVNTVNGVPTNYNWSTIDQIAKDVVDGWMKSKDHYDNIVLPTWQREGLGVFIANDDKVFATQNFHFFIVNKQSIFKDFLLPDLQPYSKPAPKVRKRSAAKVHNKPVPQKPVGHTMLAAPVNVSTYAGQNPGKYIEKQFFGAKKSAYVCAPWISKKFVVEMAEMASNGIDIKIITQSVRWNTDTVDLIRNHTYDALAPSKHSRAQNHFEYRIVPNDTFVHAKLYIIDGNYAVAGSANFTRSAMTGKNHELITIHNGIQEAKIIEDMFFKIWNSQKKNHSS